VREFAGEFSTSRRPDRDAVDRMACRGPDGEGAGAALDASKLWQPALLELWLRRHGI
jgi:hypothetical protein